MGSNWRSRSFTTARTGGTRRRRLTRWARRWRDSRGRLPASLRLPYRDSPLRQLGQVALSRNAFIRRVHARGPYVAARLHLSRDGQRVTRRALHGADAMLFIVVVEQLPRVRLRRAVLHTVHSDA